jgi:hypothetical protein
MAVNSVSTIQYPDGREERFGLSENLIQKLGTKSIREIYCYIMTHDIILGHTNANTFRKSVFDLVGYFDDRLKLHEDTELWNRIARVCLFYPAELNRPVSVARRHGQNTISQRSEKSQLWFLWVWINNIGLNSLYPCEQENFLYLYARAQSNRIKLNFIRKIVYHGIKITVNPFSFLFIRMFYNNYSKD